MVMTEVFRGPISWRISESLPCITNMTVANQMCGPQLPMGHRESTDLCVIRSHAPSYTQASPGIRGKEKQRVVMLSFKYYLMGDPTDLQAPILLNAKAQRTHSSFPVLHS